MNRKQQPVIFLDRDGVINRDSPDYIKSWPEFEFLPGSLEALVRLTARGFRIIIVTNQSALNRGYTTSAALTHLHQMLRQTVARHGGSITDIFYCPHRPDERCHCRKPAPGMLFQARDRYNLDLVDAIMVGDSAKDIVCAHRAGCGRTILVKTGNGNSALASLTASGDTPDMVCADLAAAVEWIVSQV